MKTNTKPVKKMFSAKQVGEIAEKLKKQIMAEVEEMIGKYSETVCVTCGKHIQAHYGGFYRNMYGEVFCCKECIKRPETPQP